LRTIAQTYAVRGNIHLQDFSDGGAVLPAVIELQLGGRHIVLTHGHRPGLLGFCLKGLDVTAQCLRLTNNGESNERIAHRLARLYPSADIIVFGHTHRAHVERVGGTLLVNPGAVCTGKRDQPSVARIRLGTGRPEVEIIPLSAQKQAMPNRMPGRPASADYPGPIVDHAWAHEAGGHACSPWSTRTHRPGRTVA
jgi:putative phosphoesterase